MWVKHRNRMDKSKRSASFSGKDENDLQQEEKKEAGGKIWDKTNWWLEQATKGRVKAARRTQTAARSSQATYRKNKLEFTSECESLDVCVTPACKVGLLRSTWETAESGYRMVEFTRDKPCKRNKE